MTLLTQYIFIENKISCQKPINDQSATVKEHALTSASAINFIKETPNISQLK